MNEMKEVFLPSKIAAISNFTLGSVKLSDIPMTRIPFGYFSDITLHPNWVELPSGSDSEITDSRQSLKLFCHASESVSLEIQVTSSC